MTTVAPHYGERHQWRREYSTGYPDSFHNDTTVFASTGGPTYPYLGHDEQFDERDAPSFSPAGFTFRMQSHDTTPLLDEENLAPETSLQASRTVRNEDSHTTTEAVMSKTSEAKTTTSPHNEQICALPKAHSTPGIESHGLAPQPPVSALLSTETVELAAAALPPLLPSSMIPVDGMYITAESARVSESRRINFKVVDDDWQAVDQEDYKHVRSLMSAFREDYKREPDVQGGKTISNQEQKEWTRFQEDHQIKVRSIIDCNHPAMKPELEKRCWALYNRLRDAHKHGCALTGGNQRLDLKLSERIKLNV